MAQAQGGEQFQRAVGGGGGRGDLLLPLGGGADAVGVQFGLDGGGVELLGAADEAGGGDGQGGEAVGGLGGGGERRQGGGAGLAEGAVLLDLGPVGRLGARAAPGEEDDLVEALGRGSGTG